MNGEMPKLEPLRPLRFSYSGQWCVTLPDGEYVTLKDANDAIKEAARQAMERAAEEVDELMVLEVDVEDVHYNSVLRKASASIRALADVAAKEVVK